MGNCILGWLQIVTQGAYLQCTEEDSKGGGDWLANLLECLLIIFFIGHISPVYLRHQLRMWLVVGLGELQRVHLQ